MNRQRSAGIVIFTISSFSCWAYGSDVDPPNSPEKMRTSFALLLQRELARTVDGKVYKSGEVRESVKVGPLEADAIAQAESMFVNPKKELKVEVTELKNYGTEGVRLKTKITAPIKLQGAAKAGPFMSVSLPLKGNLNLELESDIKLVAKDLTKLKADIKIRNWNGTIDDIDVGNGDANKILGPILKVAIKKIVDDNREQLQAEANKAIKKASEEGALELNLLGK